MVCNSCYMLFSLHIKNVGIDTLSTKVKEIFDLNDAKKIQKRLQSNEIYYLHTCNRVEMLISYDKDKTIDTNMLPSYKVRHDLKDIISHLLKVASGADSVLFGENQILTQFKEAMENSRKAGLTGPSLNPLLQMIIRDAKVIKSKVKITANHNSISSMAGHYIRKRARGKYIKVLLVGYSNTNRSLYLLLKKASNVEIYWTNRTHGKIDTDVKEIAWRRFMDGKLPGVDVIVLATKCNNKLITVKNLNSTNANLVVDLSVPSNASKRLVQANHVEYIGISEINELINQSQRGAKEKLEIINHIIDLKSGMQIKDLLLRSKSNVVTDILNTSEDIYNKAMNESDNYLRDLDEVSMSQVKKWSKHLVKKLNHEYLETVKLLLSR